MKPTNIRYAIFVLAVISVFALFAAFYVFSTRDRIPDAVNERIEEILAESRNQDLESREKLRLEVIDLYEKLRNEMTSYAKVDPAAKKAREKLDNGRFEEVQDFLEERKSTRDISDTQRANLAYQLGLVLEIKLNYQAAEAAYRQAQSLKPEIHIYISALSGVRQRVLFEQPQAQSLLSGSADELPESPPPAERNMDTKRQLKPAPDAERMSFNAPKIFPMKPSGNKSSMEIAADFKEFGVFDRRRNKSAAGFESRPRLALNGQVVYDDASGLMWQRGGSGKALVFSEMEKYLSNLNSGKFAGYSDWRLPTLLEAMSLMKKKKQRELNIDKVFYSQQDWIWTADRHNDGKVVKIWTANYQEGLCYPNNVSSECFVRAVR